MKELSDEVRAAILEAAKSTVSTPFGLPSSALTASTHGPSGKSMWKALMTTPGFHSSKPETWGEAKPTSKTWPEIGLPDPDEFEKEYIASFTTKEPEMAIKDMDTGELAPSVDSTMSGMATQITQALTGSKVKAFMLGEPMQLTVKKKDDSYSKRPHIGGEEFIPVRVYAGKRDTLIYVFKPTEVADYAEMEMGEAQAHEHFSGLKNFMENLIDRELKDSVMSAKKAAADNEERAKNIGNFEKYANLGYGSF